MFYCSETDWEDHSRQLQKKIAKDDEVERFVDYIHSTTNHVNFYNISKNTTNNILTLILY